MQNEPQNGQRRRTNHNPQRAGKKAQGPHEETSIEVSKQVTNGTDRAESSAAEAAPPAAAPANAPRGWGWLILDYARPAIVLTLILTLIVGVAYPLLVTGVAQVLFNSQANGSLITKNGQVIGSSLIGQEWTDPKYFYGRPSAAGAGYDASNSSASNNGPTSQQLQNEVQGQSKVLKEDEACNPPGTPIPVDLVTSSGSGLDPDISVAGAMYQACRVAKHRNMTIQQVQQLIKNHIHDRTAGVLGEPYVNVLELNMALDSGS